MKKLKYAGSGEWAKGNMDRYIPYMPTLLIGKANVMFRRLFTTYRRSRARFSNPPRVLESDEGKGSRLLANKASCSVQQGVRTS